MNLKAADHTTEGTEKKRGVTNKYEARNEGISRFLYLSFLRALRVLRGELLFWSNNRGRRFTSADFSELPCLQ